ncbi:MAG: ABC transporter ATP-binding protein [Acidimicrobiales bacterium]
MTAASATASAPGSSTAIQLEGVVKSYPTASGPLPVLDGVDLVVGRGEVAALAGRSGSGKTTLLTIVAGWEHADAGSVVLFDGDVPPEQLAWRDVALLPQSLGLLDELTVDENVRFPLRLGGVAATGRAADAAAPIMEQLGLTHLAHRLPSEVSLGEQQRAALARAAVIRPRLLLADEPIAHQNREWGGAMMTLLRSLADDGTTCLLATHNDAAFEVADHVLQLRKGRLEEVA